MTSERKRLLRCAIYTRKSSDEGLEQSFNSLDAQREACAAYIESQRHEGWCALEQHYDDGGYSGGTMERPALTALLADIKASRVDVVVVYKVDRLTRALTDFSRMVDIFDAQGVSFVSVTQQFNTTTSMGRLTLNVLLSFAQFEREVTGERIRDKIAASKKKGMWMGGMVPLGYDCKDRKLVIKPKEAELVRLIYRRYAELGCVRKLKAELDTKGLRSKRRVSAAGRVSGKAIFSRGALYLMLKNRIYLGEIFHKGQIYTGEHKGIVPRPLWDRVQATLETNNQAQRTGARALDPSLLAGLVYDEQGNRMTPCHTKKPDGRRYRYYVSQATIHRCPNEPKHASRIPAHDIETLVSERLGEYLRAGLELNQRGNPASSWLDGQERTALAAAAREMADRWASMKSVEIRRFLLNCVSQITVQQEYVEISVNRAKLRAVLIGGKAGARAPKPTKDEPEDIVRLQATGKLQRTGQVVRIVIPGKSQGDDERRPNTTLVKAIARAHDWYERILNGDGLSLDALARSVGVTEGYVRRILPCAFIAPDIVEAILDGRQPISMALDLLLDNLPIDWPAQRREIGFI